MLLLKVESFVWALIHPTVSAIIVRVLFVEKAFFGLLWSANWAFLSVPRNKTQHTLNNGTVPSGHWAAVLLHSTFRKLSRELVGGIQRSLGSFRASDGYNLGEDRQNKVLSWLADPASTHLPGREAILLKRGTGVCHGALTGSVGTVKSVGAGRSSV